MVAVGWLSFVRCCLDEILDLDVLLGLFSCLCLFDLLFCFYVARLYL